MPLAMYFEPYQFIENLHFMGKGMLGIFIVIGVITMLTLLLDIFGSMKQNRSTDQDESA